VYAPKYTTETKLKSFSNQFEDNLNQSIGFQLTIPIFNGFLINTAVKKARLSIENAELDLQIARNQLRKNIEQAYADASAALKKHNATKKALITLNESFNYAQKRYDVGIITSVEYNESKTRLEKAQSDLLQAKYDYLFKTKIIDYYQGKTLTF